MPTHVARRLRSSFSNSNDDAKSKPMRLQSETGLCPPPNPPILRNPPLVQVMSQGRVLVCRPAPGYSPTSALVGSGTLPPEMSLRGARPNHAQKCFTLGKRSISVPISLIIVWTLDADSPITATRSTPRMRAYYARVGAGGAFLVFESRQWACRSIAAGRVGDYTNWER
jgi:hypothetical protein